MKHRANRRFWQHYDRLPKSVQRIADAQFELLKQNSQHPSLHFKKVGRYWSTRVDIDYRAVAIQDGDDIVWFWIGPHREYEKLLTGH